MIAQLFKKSSLLMIALVSVVSLNAHHHSHRIQVLINQGDENFNYTLFNGDGIECCNILLPRSNGGYYYLNGYIYPKNTIDPNQSDYAFDTHGNPLNASNSFGDFHCVAQFFRDVTFDEGYPVEGTPLEDFRWDFYFNENCDGEVNNINAFGLIKAGVLAANQVLFLAEGATMAATECNEHHNFIKTAQVYWNGNVEVPQFLIDIRFEKKIKFN
jgi:hypothetical protein